MRRAGCLVLLSTALLASGCGEEEPAQPVQKGATSGKQLFIASCGSCHTLADAGTSGTVGPNLDESKPDKALVLDRIENGAGVMPAKLLEGGQAAAVADYVADVAGS